LACVEQMRRQWTEVYDGYIRQMDTSRLPLDIDGNKLRKMLELVIKGLMTEQFESGAMQPEILYEEICDYLNMMKQTVYRSYLDIL